LPAKLRIGMRETANVLGMTMLNKSFTAMVVQARGQE